MGVVAKEVDLLDYAIGVGLARKYDRATLNVGREPFKFAAVRDADSFIA